MTYQSTVRRLTLVTAILVAIGLTLFLTAPFGKGISLAQASAENNPATGAPTISGTAQVGETLTAGITGIADADGLSGETFTYQWVSSDGTTDTDIEKATDSTYKLVDADKGNSIKVRVTFTDDGGNEETLTSAATGPVLGDGLPGAARNLTATPGNKEITLSWDPPDDNGNAPATRYRIEWRVDGKDYDKNHGGTARSTTYTTNDQANLANGVKYFFRVKAGNGSGNSYGPYGPASDEVSATPTSGSAVDLDTPVLSEPEYLHHGMVQLDWQDVEDAGWYVVQYYHVKDGEWLDLPAAGVEITFHGSSAVVSNLHGLSWLRVGAASCDGASEWSQIEELYGTKESDWEGVPVPEVEEGDQTEPCPVVLGTPVLSGPEYLHHGMVQLDWQDIEDAGWYVVQYYHLEGGEWLDLPAEGVDIAFHGSSAVVSNLHGLSWLRVGAASCDGASEWSQIEQLFGTNASDWKGVPVPEVAEGDEIKPCDEDADTSDNSPATGAPTISGTVQVGETLTADTSGIADADGLANATFSYQWITDDSVIVASAARTYTPTDGDRGKSIKVRVSFTDDEGNDESLTSANTATVEARANSPATGLPTISGTAQVGETLTANTSGVADVDGLSNVQYEYQWIANDSSISGATNATYTLVAADEGQVIKVRVSFTDDAGNNETLTSAGTATVSAANTPATGAPAISGTAQVGETLTANTSGIADADGLSNVQYEYQWLADDADISGATNATYTLAAEDEGKPIKVQVGFTDDEGNEESLTSAATDAVAAAPTPNSPATGEPGLSFSWMTRVGETITADTSGIADADGFTNATFSYQWLADDVEIAGATGLTYTLVAADEGKAISVRVGFTDDAGHEETLTSWATGTVVAANVGLVVNTVIAEPVREGSYARVSFSVTRFTVGKEYSFAFGGVWIADNSALVWVRPMGICQAGGLDFSMDILVDSSDTVITHEGLISDRCPAGDYKLVVSWRTEDGEEEGRHLTSFQVLEDDTEVDEYSSQYVDYITPEYPDPPAEHGPFFIGLLSTAGPGWGSVIYNWGIAGVVPDSDPDTLDYVVSLRVVDDDNNPVANCNEDGVGGSYKLYTIPEDRGWGRKVTLSARCMSGAGSATFTIEFLNGSSELLLRAESPLGAARPNGDEADTPDGDDENAPLGVVINTVIAEPVQEGVGANVSVSVTGFTVGESYELSFGKVTPTNVCSVNSVDSIPVDLADYRWTINVDSSDYVWTKEGFISPRCPAGTYYLEVSYTNLNGHEKGVSSSLFSVVAALPNSPATGTPTISGTAQVGETLTANTSGVIDADGLSNVQYEYQWLASRDNEIGGATGSTYTLVAADEGKAITVQVSFTDDEGNQETLTSTATDAVSAAPAANSPATGVPTISGTAQVGETLTADTSGVTDADGLSNVQYEYQWLADDADITGATNATYTLVAEDEGKAIKVQVSFTDDEGNAETLTSAATAAVTAAPPSIAPGEPQNLELTPVAVGTTGVGIKVFWDAPSATGGSDISGYRIQWKGGSQDYPDDQETRQAFVENAPYTIDTSSPSPIEGDELTVRIAAVNGAGAGVWTEKIGWLPSHTDLELWLLMKEYADEKQTTFPWVLETWNYLDRHEVPVEVGPTPGFGSVILLPCGSLYTNGDDGLKECHVDKIKILQIEDPKPRIIIHEMAHAYTLANRVTDAPAPLAIGHLYFDSLNLQGGLRGCEPRELYADVLTMLTLHIDKSSYWETCNRGNAQRQAQALSVVRSAVNGEIPQWFADTYTDAEDEPDLERLWTDVQDLPRIERNVAVYQLRDAFGGYCNNRLTWKSMQYSEDKLTQPWMDGGCPPPEPTSLEVTPGDGELTLAWDAPASDGDSDVEGYIVQWKSAYHDWATRQSRAVLDSPTSLTYTISGLGNGVEYDVRVRAYNHIGPGQPLDGESVTLSEPVIPNTPATGVPTISGTAQVGETLTVDTSGIADEDGMENELFTFFWHAYDATGLDLVPRIDNQGTYTIEPRDVGMTIYVLVILQDDRGNFEVWESAPTDAVAAAPAANSPAIGVPTISGTAQVGETLEADTSGVTDADGLSNVQYEYQWLADDSDIAGATGSTYTLVAEDEGKAITVQVSFTDDADNEETLTSGATDTVEAAPNTNSPAIGAPTISGTAQVGETLTANTSGVADVDGLSNVQYEYQWLADDADIAGATGSTYTLTDSEESKAITVQISFTDDADNEETLTSAATGAVGARPNSPATGAPTITGTAQVGQTLTADTSGIADADGLSNVQYEYQWLADGADIAGATGLTYTLTDSEENKPITVQVSFTDDADNEETLTSAATAAVAGAQPTEPPAKPEGLEATATHDSVTLTWDDPGDDTITGYVILRRIPGVDPQGHFDVLVADTGTTATSYTDDTVAAETRYTYRIKAINGAGTSERSRWYHIDTPAAPVPDKPTGLEATESHGQVVLTWDDPGDDSITGYVILRRVRVNNTGGDFSVLVANTGSAATTYIDNTVAANTTYTYRIKAINEHGTSERSRWYHIDIPEAP